MFAMLIASETMPKIQEANLPTPCESSCKYLLRSTKSWYLVRGFYLENGPVHDWTILPAYLIEKHYQHNPNVIKTDWDQIVRN